MPRDEVEQRGTGGGPALRWLPRIAIFCTVAAALALIALHLLEPRSPTEPLSYFSVGRFGLLYALALGLASGAFAATAVDASRRHERLLWMVAAFGALAAAVAPSRGASAATPQDQIHLVGMLLLLVGGASALMASTASRTIAIATTAGVALSIALKVTQSAMLGVAQRLTIALLLAGTLSALFERRRA